MKKSSLKCLILAAAFLSTLAAARAQGTVDFNNNVPGVLRTPIYGPEPTNPTLILFGNTPTSIPVGGQAYTGPLLSGSGFTAQLWAGPAAALDPGLGLVAQTIFRTGAGAGFVVPVNAVAIPGVPTGNNAWLRVRVWDNTTGVTSWSVAQTTPGLASGQSPGFTLPAQLLPNLSPASLTGLRSFNIHLPCLGPGITCPASITTNIVSGSSVAVSFASPAITVGALQSCTPASGSTFALGTNAVTCTATNACGGSNCSFTVTVALQPALITTGSTWRYLANGSDQGTAWHAPGFNDSAWSNGVAKLGFGGDGEVTTIGITANGYTTFYFRQSFTVADTNALQSLEARMIVDDGVVVYLNGVEALRRNMPAGTVLSSTLAPTTVGAPEETSFFTNTLNRSLLVNGVNVLAAEVHQVATTSSDLGWEFELTGASNAPPLTVALTSVAPLEGPVGANVTATATVANGLGQVDFYLDGRLVFQDAVSPYTLNFANLTAGAHALAAVAHGFSGSRATSAPVTVTITNEPGFTYLVPNGSVWKYLDDGSDQGTNWRELAFDDSGWSNGMAELGFGDSTDNPPRPERTVINGGPPTNRIVTTYFRRTFTVANPASSSNVLVRLLRDDGGVAYLNGVEVFRSNMPTGAVNYATLTGVNATDDGTAYFSSTNLSPALLVAGPNVLAVEIHQSATNSSDLSFDAMLLGQSAAPNCIPPPPGLVLWLPFDETSGTTAQNLAGGNHGVLVNGPTHSPGSYVSNSLCFDGVDDYVQVPTYPAIEFGTGDFTVDAWVKPGAPSGPIWAIVGHRELILSPLTVRGYVLLLWFNNEIAFQMGDGGVGSWQNFESSLVVPFDNQWHHIAVTVKRGAGGVITAYLDGVPQIIGTPYPGSVTPPPTIPLYVGGDAAAPATSFNGCIDEVALYNRELAPAEIAALYNAGSAGKCSPPVIAYQPQSQCVAAGQRVTFSVVALGNPAPTYQWKKNGVVLTAAFSSTFTIPAVSSSDAGDYAVEVSNSAGTVLSSVATLTVGLAMINPSFEVDTFTVFPGYSGNLANGPITGWASPGQHGVNPGVGFSPFADNGTIPHGAQVAFLHDNGAMSQVVSGFTVGASYRVEFFENARNCCSGTVPSLEVKIGGNTIVAAHLVSPVGGANSYRRVSSAPFTAGATSLELAFIKSNPQGGDTAALIDNVCVARATAPTITAQPQSLTVTQGQNATFSVTATGAEPLHYQWRRDGAARAGATNSTLTLSNVQPNDAGIYDVVVSNAFGSVTSTVATLTVNYPPCPSPVLTQVAYTGNGVTLSFQSLAGFRYAIEYKNTLNDPAWTALQSVLATSSLTTVQAAVGTGRSRFYQVVCQGPLTAPLTALEPPQASPAQPGGSAGCGAGAQDDSLPYLFSGEFHHTVTDLVIKGRGLDFVWARTYRSKIGLNTAQGKGWDFSCNIHVAPSGTDFDVSGGDGRTDKYRRQDNGTYGADQLFCEGTLSNEVFRLIFPDGGIWQFRPLDGSAAQGKINNITDRNGNALTFQYSGGGQLTNVIDTLGRNIQVVWNADGFISAITDFTGRSVRYAYYQNGDAGGSFGDLKSVTSPAVTGTPNGNDFPGGKTNTYTYSKGFGDDRLNHNLLTCTDAKGQTWLANTYATNQTPSDYNFDRLLSQVHGDSDEVLTFFYKPQVPVPANQFAVTKAIVNDRMGNVSEHLFDGMNNLLRLRQFTGRAVRRVTTTETLNRPTNKLRPGDPDYFETRLEWNADSKLTRVVHPNGNSEENTYELALNPSASRRFRGNMRVRTSLPGPLGGEQPMLQEHYEYATDFGGCCGFNCVTRAVDARGNEVRHRYDARGNRTNTVQQLPSVVEGFAYNAFGQMTAHVLPDNGSGSRRRDVMTYYTNGLQAGYLQQSITDAGGFNLTNRYEYDAVGNVVRAIDPRGKDTLYAVNALNQRVRETSREVSDGSGVRYRRDTFYDDNNNVVRTAVHNLDERGVVQTNWMTIDTNFRHEILNRVTTIFQEITPGRCETNHLHYDANRNLRRVDYGQATKGWDHDNILETRFDERNLAFIITRAPEAPIQSSTQQDYDRNGNLVRTMQGLEDVPRSTLHAYDGYNRRLATTDAMGNVMTAHYDANGNMISERTDGELVDVPGSSGNVRLSEMTNTYDPMNRKTHAAAAYFHTGSGMPINGGQAVRQTVYAGTSQVLQEIDADGHATTIAHDTTNRRRIVTDPKGNTTTYTYDAGSRVVLVTEVDKSDLGSPDQTFITTQTYDNLDRLIQSVDNVGNTNRSAYDSRNNRTLDIDGRGNVTRFAYDGLKRLTQTTRLLTDTGLGSGTVIDTITTSQTWDDSSRLTAQIDDNANATSYVYDSLNRLVSEVFADGTANSVTYDVHDNPVSTTDANGTVVTTTYDLGNRATARSVTPATTVLGTTFENYQYDGLSRKVRAANDGSVVTRAHDSLSHVTTETQQVLPGGPVRTVACAYDNVGNQVSCTYPGGRVVDSTFDALHRKQVIADLLGGLAAYSYRGPGRVQRRDNGNGTRTEYGHDGLRRPASTRHTRIAGGAVLDDRAYAWDPAHNKTAATDLLPMAQDARSFGYDSADRMRRSTVATVGPVIDYTLDGVGNRTLVAGGAQPGAYFLNPAAPPADAPVNQYTTTPFDARTYDANGNLLTAGAQQFFYDFQNRLVVAYRSGTNTLTAKYDCFGRRIEKAVPGAMARYYYDGWQEIEEQDGANATAATYVWGESLDELIEMTRNGQSFFYHADDLGSVRKVTDGTGNVVEQYNYGDYGQPSFFNAAGTPFAGTQIGNFTLYTGRRYDPETGLYYYRTRYLDPLAGRFTTRDSIGVWGDANNLGNGYSYVGNRSPSATDPMGLTPRTTVCFPCNCPPKGQAGPCQRCCVSTMDVDVTRLEEIPIPDVYLNRVRPGDPATPVSTSHSVSVILTRSGAIGPTRAESAAISSGAAGLSGRPWKCNINPYLPGCPLEPMGMAINEKGISTGPCRVQCPCAPPATYCTCPCGQKYPPVH